jgi:hypothetical protein
MSLIGAAGDAVLRKMCPEISYRLDRADISVTTITNLPDGKQYPAYVSGLAALVTAVSNSVLKLTQMAASVSVNCEEAGKIFDDLVVACENLGSIYAQAKTSATMTPTANPVTERLATLPRPSDWWKTLLWVAAVGAGVYVAYRYVWPLFGHDDGEIPQHKLPRYAGGSRR